MQPIDRPALRVLAVHDLSGVGKCSLAVALPILSAMGAEVAALPTAILSTHTGGLTGYTYRDLTEDMAPIAAHWESLGLAFDAIYSGWLASAAQCRIMQRITKALGREALIFVDPVMGDHGRLYSTFTQEQVEGMAALCRGAALITPNLTEACFLLGQPYQEGPMAQDAIHGLAAALSSLGPQQVVITGIATKAGRIGAAAYDGRNQTFTLHETGSIPGVWHGTGDIFGSVLLGGLLSGLSLPAAAELSVSFVSDAIGRTAHLGLDPRLGVDFERGLPGLMKALHPLC